LADATPSTPTGGALSLEDLIALNDEIAALVRAGVPLERGLLDVGGDLRGRLAGVARALGERLSRGEALPQALAAEGDRVPRVYRAVVEAGMKAGRLPVALEGLAGFARGYAELRRAVGLALLYPLVVVLLAYGLFVGFVLGVAPRFMEAFGSLRLPVHTPLAWLARLGDSVVYWGPVGPAVLLLVGVWWLRSGRAATLQSGWVMGPLGWLPWMRRMLANTRAANFAELLALLVENRIPMPEGVELAADATGDPALRRAADEVAAASRRGEPPGAGGSDLLPPLLRWVMAAGGHQGDLVSALRHAARVYRRRALHQAELVRIFVPILLLFALGATVTALYALTLFVPLTELLGGLADV
jgi:type II secretory pathway component PulF